MPKPLDAPESIHKNGEGRWVRYCPKCGSEVTHLRRNYCIGAHNMEQLCKRCSNVSNNPSGMVGSVRLAWYEAFRKSAICRGYDWELTPEYIDAMYEQQNGCCSLTGLQIGWSETKWDHTASIDRINNNLGYTEDNVHLVHKRVNMMRGTMDIDEFVQFCHLVSTKVTHGTH